MTIIEKTLSLMAQVKALLPANANDVEIEKVIP